MTKRKQMMLMAAAVIVIAGAGAVMLLNPRRQAARKIGDASLLSHSMLRELKASLGSPDAIEIPEASAKVSLRLEQVPSYDSGAFDDPSYRSVLSGFRAQEPRLMILGEAHNQAEVTFGRGIVRAGFYTQSEDPSLIPWDFIRAVWIEVSPPFKGSMDGVHLGDPWLKARRELESRVWKTASEGAFVSAPLSRDLIVTESRGVKKKQLNMASGHLLSRSVPGVPGPWLVLVECNESNSSKPVTRLTAWNADYRTAMLGGE